MIVLGSNMYGKTCYGGSQLIPTYENQYDSLGHFAEYVIDAKADMTEMTKNTCKLEVNI